MDALVMCGGRGTRLGLGIEKPLLPIGGRPMVDRVISALEGSKVDRIVAATSPHTPDTAAHVDVPTVRTAGDGYVVDLQEAITEAALAEPLVTVTADLPLLTAAAVDSAITAHEGTSVVTAVPVPLKLALGCTVDTSFERNGVHLAPTGLNIVDDQPDQVVQFDAPALAVNVNRPRDAWVAEMHC